MATAVIALIAVGAGNGHGAGDSLNGAPAALTDLSFTSVFTTFTRRVLGIDQQIGCPA